MDWLDWLVYILPQRLLIYLCEQAKTRNGISGGLDEGNKVVRISDSVAVKYGLGVTLGEAATQNYAYQHLNQEVVRVPEVYRFFQDWSDPRWPKGYLFMEYIPGQTLEDLDILGVDDDVHRHLADIVVSELAAVISSDDVPGQVDGGILQGYLWGDEGTREIFHSVEDMNQWLNKRLQLIDKSIDLHPYPLVLCHLDLCRRNIKLTEDNSMIALLDWGHAGFFPRFFEAASLLCINDNATYGDSLCKAISEKEKLTDGEQECVKLLLRARAASLRYTFEPLEDSGIPADIDSWPPLPPLPPPEPLTR